VLVTRRPRIGWVGGRDRDRTGDPLQRGICLFRLPIGTADGTFASNLAEQTQARQPKRHGSLTPKASANIVTASSVPVFGGILSIAAFRRATGIKSSAANWLASISSEATAWRGDPPFPAGRSVNSNVSRKDFYSPWNLDTTNLRNSTALAGT